MHSAQLSFLYETSATHAVTDPKQQQSARPVHVADATRCAIDRAGQLLHWQQLGEGRQAVAGHQSIWTARRRAWTEHPDRSTPSSADGHCVGRLQPLLICRGQQSMAVMAQAAEPRGCRRCGREVVPRFVFVPLGPAPYVNLFLICPITRGRAVRFGSLRARYSCKA